VGQVDFLASAAAVAPVLETACRRRVGETVLAAVEATRRVAAGNTNLGIVLLLAPLARAAARTDGDLRSRLAAVLEETTVADAAEAYVAIRAARPGGLGATSTEDVAAAPTVTLREAMALAAERDAIAREYITAFGLTFEVGAPALTEARRRGLSWTDATVECFLALLAAVPDTHIARKLGRAEAERLSARAREVVAAGATASPAGRAELAAFDAELRDSRNMRNPGTTADLTCAALFIVILEGGWNR
jgi:triphosphoribosyl-dephospho-CoA synthase